MPNTPFNNINFKTLLESIKQQGIAVGVPEVQRLQTIFKQTPSLSRSELRSLLCDCLAKNDSQRRAIKHLYDLLIPYESPDLFLDEEDTTALSTSQNTHKAKVIKSAEKPAKKSPNIWRLSLAILSVIVVGILLFVYLNQATETLKPIQLNKPIQESQKQQATAKPIKDKQNAKLLETIPRIDPIITVEHVSIFKRILPSLLLFIASSLGFIYLLQQLLKRTRIIKPVTPAVSGRGRLTLPPLDKPKSFYLLSGEERRSMVWGIDCYLDEAQSNRLDIVKTIQATAKQGLPDIHFQQSMYEREIWLWQDQTSQNPDLFRLAKEITETLKSYNTVVKPAYFQGFPALVKNKRREVVWSLKHNELSNQPFVLILMDAESLQQSQIRQQDEMYQVFNSIKQWDIRSAVVDCNPQSQQLCQLLKPFELECLKPNELAAWLAQQEHKNNSLQCSQDELQQWAMACVVAGRMVLEDEIRDIHDHLKLGCTLQYKQLEHYAKARADGFDFSEKRMGLLKNLADYAKQDVDFVQKVITYWVQRFQQIDEALNKQNDPNTQWQDSQHQHNLHIETALLQLWDNKQISTAVDTLFGLFQLPKLSPYIKNKLGSILFADFPANIGKHLEKDTCLKLPISWGKINSNSRLKLLKMGLGGETYQCLNAKWDQQSNLVLGALLGVMLIALLGLIYFALPK